MKKYSYVFWTLFFALTFGACAKNDNNCDPNDEGSPCYSGPSAKGKLLLVEQKTDGVMVARYEYDGQNRLTNSYLHDDTGKPSTTVSYAYNSNGLLSTVSHKDQKSEKDMVLEYTYGNGNKPVSMIQTSHGNTDDFLVDFQFTYSANKLVETITPQQEGMPISVQTYTYDDQGNLLSVESTIDGEWYTTLEMGDYDDKVAIGLYGNPYVWQFPGTHNHRWEKTTSLNGVADSERIHEYTYDDAGYPIKCEVYDKESNTLLKTHTYSYERAK